jgi:8-oxo-dGTP pyrophosphatase MutT (NUDIX family)|tara:strand:+ start:82 stop:540 length:459 start_codon:yes stop_codon:yes gene_type:complete
MNYKWKKFITEGELKTVGIVICVNDKEEFLIIRRSDIDKRAGQWTMPGGHVDDEDGGIEQGAIRELEEETGLSCKISDLIYLGEPRLNKHYYVTQDWTGSVDIDKPNPHTGEIEHDNWKWATIEEIKEIENTEIPIYLLKKALEKVKNETPI